MDEAFLQVLVEVVVEQAELSLDVPGQQGAGGVEEGAKEGVLLLDQGGMGHRVVVDVSMQVQHTMLYQGEVCVFLSFLL